MTTTQRGPQDAGPDRNISTPAISVVICTYNRADLLPAAIEHVLAQDDPGTPPFELIIVDNNSTDGTAAVVERASALDGRVLYVRETKQGVSHARNAGVAAARAPLIALTDDDVRVGRAWLASLALAFAAYPGASVVGGKVLPIWPETPPSWLTKEHWGPLALADHGDVPLRVDAANQLCLLGANMAVRRSLFEEIGYFAAAVQRVNTGIGSSEDHEFQLRLFRRGGFGIYDPRIVIHAAVQPDRLDLKYHRRWHTGHGHFNALMRPEYLEVSTVGRLFDVPAHMYRAAAADAVGWLRAVSTGRRAEAFSRELRLRFFLGFIRTRRGQFRSLPADERRRQWQRLLRGLIGWRPEAAGPAASAGGRS
jgi:glucosyl-dolichyl phosphate glucuronosyltransferase